MKNKTRFLLVASVIPAWIALAVIAGKFGLIKITTSASASIITRGAFYLYRDHAMIFFAGSAFLWILFIAAALHLLNKPNSVDSAVDVTPLDNK